MKKSILIFLIGVCSLLSPLLWADWQSDFRLTNNPAASNFPTIVASGQVLNVFWDDNRDGNVEIYQQRSSDGGANWLANDIRLTYDTSNAGYPFAAVSGAYVFVVWWCNHEGNKEIYYKRSGDGGINWAPEINLSNDPAVSQWAYVAAFMATVHVVWCDNRDGNQEIYYRRAGSWGLSWGSAVRLTNNPSSSITPTVDAKSSTVHVVWCDNRDGNQEIYYKRSTDDGLTWGFDTRLTNDPASSVLPFVSSSGSYVHVIWYDFRDGNNEVYYKHSTNYGIDWQADVRLTNDPGDSHDPYITSSGANVHVVWHDNRNGNYEIYHRMSADNGSNWMQEERLTNAPGASQVASIVTSGEVSHVVWQDNRDGNLEIYYKKDPNGNPTGITSISSQVPGGFMLEQNYPNPFNPATKIDFAIPANGIVTIKVYDMVGREVATLVNQQLKPGTYAVNWDASNYPSGVYFYKLITSEFTDTKRMVQIK